MDFLPLAVTLDFLTATEFWLSVLVLAGIYALVALGLQLNVGFTGITNFGAAGFMAIGAYTMALLVVDAGWSFWLALPASMVASMLFGLLVGLPSLRLRADYFAIATIALSELVRATAQNATSLTNGTQGLFSNDQGTIYFDDTWRDLSTSLQDWLNGLPFLDNVDGLAPLLLVVWVAVVLVAIGLSLIQKTPWGRVLRAVREDEDAARALGKNAFSYKLQSLAIAAAIGALAGTFLALYLASLHPDDFQPLVTFYAYGVLVLGGLASYWGVLAGSVILLVLLEGTRYIELPISDTQEASLRFFVVGIVLILVMVFRPQGAFGNKQEMFLGE
jgi:branched-chain amino acid transport system permease protein